MITIDNFATEKARLVAELGPRLMSGEPEDLKLCRKLITPLAKFGKVRFERMHTAMMKQFLETTNG